LPAALLSVEPGVESPPVALPAELVAFPGEIVSEPITPDRLFVSVPVVPDSVVIELAESVVVVFDEPELSPHDARAKAITTIITGRFINCFLIPILLPIFLPQ
jgi:hypothetical protein